MEQNEIRELMDRAVAAFEGTVRSTIALAETFTADQWGLPTDCPGWTVKDQVSHIVGIERMLLGDPQPPYDLPADLPHVRNDFGRLLEVDVALRRSVPGEKVLDELREVLERRLAALPEIDPAMETFAPNSRRKVPYAEFMIYRAFDCYVHEQDIRRAVGRPGGLDAPAAACCHQILAPGLPYVVAKKAGARPGQSAAFEVGGAFPFTALVLVGDDGRARTVGSLPSPTTTLRMDWEAYMRLAAGRGGPEDVTVSVEGDADLAARILANMAITP